MEQNHNKQDALSSKITAASQNRPTTAVYGSIIQKCTPGTHAG
jgi:hypothetical protein